MDDPDNDTINTQFGSPYAVKFADGGQTGVFDGYAARFNGIDNEGDTVMPGAFAATIAAHKAAGTAPILLWSHDQSQPIGKIIAMHEDAVGLKIRAVLNMATAAGARAYAHLIAKDVNGLSIGYRPAPGGAEHKRGGGRILRQIDLQEISVVALPSDNGARIGSVKQLESLDDLERGLRGEIQLQLPHRAARKCAAAAWKALIGPDEPDPAAQELAQQRANQAAIDRLAAKFADTSNTIKALTTKGRIR